VRLAQLCFDELKWIPPKAKRAFGGSDLPPADYLRQLAHLLDRTFLKTLVNRYTLFRGLPRFFIVRSFGCAFGAW
jgi:hypothetical protein